MIEIQNNKSTSNLKNNGANKMKRRNLRNKKLANIKRRRKLNAKKATITYKQTPREKTARLLAAQDLAHYRSANNAFNVPEWIDHDILWDIQRKNPINFTT